MLPLFIFNDIVELKSWEPMTMVTSSNHNNYNTRVIREWRIEQIIKEKKPVFKRMKTYFSRLLLGRVKSTI